jgi:hypothetical protein
MLSVKELDLLRKKLAGMEGGNKLAAREGT